jgi:hypothetical protein
MQLYALAFSWCVAQINTYVSAEGHEDDMRCIGVLDIFGFENFESSNFFPQLCINYTNELLHNLFIEHVLQQEQVRPDAKREEHSERVGLRTRNWTTEHIPPRTQRGAVSFVRCRAVHGVSWLAEPPK